MEPDPAIEQVREVRHRISARFDHDPEKLVRHYIELQREFRGRVLETPAPADGTEEHTPQAERVAERPPRDS